MPTVLGAHAPGGYAHDVTEKNQLEAIRSGYAFDGASLELGAAVEDNTAKPDVQVRLPLSMMNRHGLIAGATGTGKTKTLQLMAEQLATNGVPVFMADIKGDLSGLAEPGESNDKVAARAKDVGQAWEGKGFDVEYLSLGGEGKGVPVRATVTSFGPTLLSKVLGLNATQESSLGLIFHYADANGLALLDLRDLRAVITHLTSDEGKADLKNLGGLSSATAGVILRNLIAFADGGAEVFFGEPEFATSDLMRTGADGRGIITCLELPSVAEKPALFSTFLMWMLADLFQELPEAGDLDKPKLVFFFDEAHLLFDGSSKAFVDQIEQTVRLIRSKGVGVFFVTQTPKDVPSGVLGQLGNRVQHALRAFTPDDQKALTATVRTFPKSGYDLEELLTTLGTGEAIVTVLSETGAPTPVAWTRMLAPTSKMGPAAPETMDRIVSSSPLAPKYSEAIDRESAYEKLQGRLTPDTAGAGSDADAAQNTPAPEAPHAPAKKEKDDPGLVSQVVHSSAFKSFMRSAGTQIGREITRSHFGTARRR